MDNAIKSAIAGAIAGAAIQSAVAVLIFFMGNFSTQESFQRGVVEALSKRFQSVEKDMSYEKAIEVIYKEKQDMENELETIRLQLNELQDLADEKQATENELRTMKLQLNELQSLVDEKQAIIDSVNSTDEINKILFTATEYWNSSDFVQSLTVLNNSKSRSDTIENLYKQYSDEYNKQLLQEADVLFSQGKRDEAIKILEEGKKLVFNCEVLDAKIQEIRSKSSVLLSSLTPVSGTLNEKQYALWDVYAKDNYENRYSSGVCMKQSYKDKLHLVYALNGKFTKLTGKFVLSEESKNTDGNYVLYAYTLDNGEIKCIYESPVLTTATRPIDVEITVIDVMDLVIEVYDPDKKDYNAWTALVDARLE